MTKNIKKIEIKVRWQDLPRSQLNKAISTYRRIHKISDTPAISLSEVLKETKIKIA